MKNNMFATSTEVSDREIIASLQRLRDALDALSLIASLESMRLSSNLNAAHVSDVAFDAAQISKTIDEVILDLALVSAPEEIKI